MIVPFSLRSSAPTHAPSGALLLEQATQEPSASLHPFISTHRQTHHNNNVPRAVHRDAIWVEKGRGYPHTIRVPEVVQAYNVNHESRESCYDAAGHIDAAQEVVGSARLRPRKGEEADRGMR